MKKIILPVFLLPLLWGCENNESSDNNTTEQTDVQKTDSLADAYSDTASRANRAQGAAEAMQDANFVEKASGGGMMEVELGRLAKTNATSPRVKAFGAQMVTDHSKANDELKEIARPKNMPLASSPDNNMQREIDELKQKRGDAFDKAYIDLMVEDHKKDINEFQQEAARGNDAELKAWASGKIATLKHHLQMAEEIQKQLKGQ